jgi:hypothetical protein
MYYKKLQDTENINKESGAGWTILHRSNQYLSNLLEQLDAQLDKRLVRTFYNVFIAMLLSRNRSDALLLTELGALVLGPKRAKAGVKRVSNLFRSKKWDYKIIDLYLEDGLVVRLKDKREEGKSWLMLWDDSVLEKPESWFSEGLSPVHSKKGQRLTRIKTGYYEKHKRICVPGFEWSGAVLTSLYAKEVPQICKMRWFATRGKYKEDSSEIFYCMFNALNKRVKSTPANVLHVFDRGYANGIFVERMLNFKAKFLVRWKKLNNLIDENGVKKNTYRLSVGQKAKDHRLIWDHIRKETRSVKILYRKVAHPWFPEVELYLVVVRDKRKGTSPMYLLTNDVIDTCGKAWEMFYAYMKRWDIEQVFRYGKSELGMESPRLWFFENRLKMLMLVTLVMDFLFRLLRNFRDTMTVIMNVWCPRTGNRHRKTSMPIYRLRKAIHFVLTFLFCQCALQNSG